MALSKAALAKNREIRRNKFKRTLKALSWAAPWALASRFPDVYRCIEASLAGAAALRAHGIEAQPIVCAVAAFSKEGNTANFIGLNAVECYEFAEKVDGETFEEWKAQQEFANTNEPVHMAIRANYHGNHAFVDLTLGQLRRLGAKLPGRALVHISDDEWPRLESDHTDIRYMRCPHEDRLADLLATPPPAGLATDLAAIMKLALECDLNEGAFARAVVEMSYGLDLARYGITRDQLLASVREYMR